MTGTMKIVNVPRSACPYCGKFGGSAAGDAENPEPSPGDIVLCLRCGEILVFADDLTVRSPTTEELLSAAKLAGLDDMRRNILAWNRETRGAGPCH